MSIPGRLYDLGTSPETLIATVRLTVQRRAEPVVARNKGDDGWEDLSPGMRTLSMRVRAVGITSSAWMAALVERWRLGLIASYRVSFDAGDSHVGDFAIVELDEDADALARRRFSLTLRSSGPVT